MLRIRTIAYTFAVLAALILVWAGYAVATHYLFWTPTESVSFTNGDVQLSGTLVKPGNSGVFPAVIMLHGAERATRDGVGYRIHAKTFLRKGFAVLLYDKRGAGMSGGDFDTATFADLIGDAQAAINYLAGRPDIDRYRIGLMGASQSGWFMPEIALKNEGVSFVINRVGPAVSYFETVLWEIRNDSLLAGASDEEVAQLLAVTRSIWNFIMAASADPKLIGSDRHSAIHRTLVELSAEIPDLELYLAGVLEDFRSERYEWLAERLSYDPVPFLEQLDVPILYVYGANDVNVPSEACIALLRSIRSQYRKDITVRLLKNVGHSLQDWRGILSGGYPPGYLRDLGSWVDAHSAPRNLSERRKGEQILLTNGPD